MDNHMNKTHVEPPQPEWQKMLEPSSLAHDLALFALLFVYQSGLFLRLKKSPK